MDSLSNRIAKQEVYGKDTADRVQAIDERCVRITTSMTKKIDELTKNQAIIQRDVDYIRHDMKGLRESVDNGVKEVIREAIKEVLPPEITIKAKSGLGIPEKVVVAFISAISAIIVAIIYMGGVS